MFDEYNYYKGLAEMELVCLILGTLSIVGVIGWLLDMLERPKAVKKAGGRKYYVKWNKKERRKGYEKI